MMRQIEIAEEFEAKVAELAKFNDADLATALRESIWDHNGLLRIVTEVLKRRASV